MVRWLEANGYDVSYFTDVDSDRNGALIKNHQVFMSNGHDEYWSGGQRANVEAARDAGTNLAFFSGNEIFWKTRWENSIDGSGTPYRTLVCYKETHANAVIDPSDPPTWTGTWRDPRFSPPADGGRPENALAGTIFMVNDGATTAIKVPAADGKMRFWRNTSIATLSPGSTATLTSGTLGYEWDEDLDNGSRPAGLFDMSTTTYNGAPVLQDYGSNYASGTATHHLTLYRAPAPSGALVFGAGTVQWSWGLDGHHDGGTTTPDVRMQQATVNLFADMGVQPATLQSGLTAATASTDKTPPTSAITAPAAGTNVQSGTPVTITGTATDAGGGVVGGVEVSVDNGTTWHPATGRGSWSYTWTPGGSSGPVTIKSRAVDDSGNLETPGAGITVTVQGGQNNPSGTSIFIATATPVTAADPDTSSTELGVKFRSDVAGSVTGIRFYKASTNTGTHVGSLWSGGGALLAQATFANETASGWQQVTFSSPVAIAANTTYVASYHAPNGHYAEDDNYFASSGVDSAPLHALAAGVDGPDGVYAYGASSTFPTNNYLSANYWVDVVFSGSQPGTAATSTTLVSSPNPSASGQAVTFTATVGPVARHRDAHRHGDLQGRLDHPGHRHAQRRHGDLHHLGAGGRDAQHHRGLRRRRQLRHQHLRRAEPGRQPGGHEHDAGLLGQPLGFRPGGDLHGHGGAPCPRHRDAHRHGDLQGRHGHPGHRHAQRRHGDLHHLGAGGWDAQHHRGLRRRRQLRHQHLRRAEPGRQPGGHEHDAGLLGQPLGFRPGGDLHGHRRARRPRHRDAHRHGDLQGRLDHPGHRHAQRRGGHLHHLGAGGRDATASPRPTAATPASPPAPPPR